jgi:SAM-dependent methyltransferase
VLDFGGGLGYFSQILRRKGIHADTYDPYAPANLKIDSLSNWDTTACFHVLEHTNDLDELVGTIKDLLAEDGKLIIEVPNRNSTGFKFQSTEWVWTQAPVVHIFHFTAIAMTKLFERHGFVIEKTIFRDRWDANFLYDTLFFGITKNIDPLWAKFINHKKKRRIFAYLLGRARFFFCFLSNLFWGKEDPSKSELRIILRKKNSSAPAKSGLYSH